MGSPSFLPLYHKQAGAVLGDCLHCGDSAALGAETSPAAPSKKSNSIGDYSPKSGTSRKKWPNWNRRRRQQNKPRSELRGGTPSVIGSYSPVEFTAAPLRHCACPSPGCLSPRREGGDATPGDVQMRGSTPRSPPGRPDSSTAMLTEDLPLKVPLLPKRCISEQILPPASLFIQFRVLMPFSSPLPFPDVP